MNIFLKDLLEKRFNFLEKDCLKKKWLIKIFKIMISYLDLIPF